MEQQISIAQIERLRSKLKEHRNKLQQELLGGKLAPVTAESESQDYELTYVEGLNQEVKTEIDVHRSFELRETESALERMNNGHYGVCQDCGAGIGIERLTAYPMARRCFNCKQTFEKKSAIA